MKIRLHKLGIVEKAQGWTLWLIYECCVFRKSQYVSSVCNERKASFLNSLKKANVESGSNEPCNTLLQVCRLYRSDGDSQSRGWGHVPTALPARHAQPPHSLSGSAVQQTEERLPAFRGGFHRREACAVNLPGVRQDAVSADLIFFFFRNFQIESSSPLNVGLDT